MVTVEFRDTKPLWYRFYTHYHIELGEPNEKGWVNFNCPLPTHPKKDTGKKGGVCLFTGQFKCWNTNCQEAYMAKLATNSETLSAAEFLMLTQDLPRSEANQIVESFRVSEIGEQPEKTHIDPFTKAYSPLAHWNQVVAKAQQALSPDLDIVREYMSSRGLLFETLKEAGVGYLSSEDNNGGQECLLFPYTQNKTVVGIRARSFSGAKSGVKNSYATLYQLDSILETKSQTVVLCEGETDTLVTKQILKKYGYGEIPVLGIPGNYFKLEWARHLSLFTRIIVIAQTDKASRRLVYNIQTADTELATKCEIVYPPFGPLSHGKDVADFVMLDKKNEKVLVELLGLSTEDIEPIPRLIPPSRVLKEAEKDVSWIIPELIERGTKVLLVGEPKTFKTWISLQLLVSIIYKEPFLGVETWTPTQENLKALLVEEEGSLVRLAQRLKKLIGNRPIPENSFRVVYRQSTLLDNEKSFSQLRQDCLRVRPDIIILDPYHSLHLQDENSAQGVAVVMRSVNLLLRALPKTTIFIIHHTPKGGKGARGSGALWGSVDMKLEVRKLESGNIKLDIEGRDFIEDESQNYEFMFDRKTGKHRLTDVIVTTEGRRRLTRQEAIATDVLSLFQREPERWFVIEEVQEILNLSAYSTRTSISTLYEKQRILRRGEGTKNNPYEYKFLQ
ncbi:MAG: AAA family ATPase [Candidatus Heimdallarchaeaceae archaeon]